MNMSCVDSDLQCPRNLVCYEDPVWLEGVKAICTCSHWYGWAGANCTALSTPAYVLASSAGLQLLLACGLFLLGAAALWRYFALHGLQRNAQSTSLVFCVIALISIAMWRLSIILIVFSPERNVLEAQANDEDKIHELVPLERAAIVASLTFSTLASLQVSLVWVQVARQSKRMTPTITKGLVVYSRAVYAFEAAWILGLVVMVATGETALIAFFSVPFLAIILLTYLIGTWRMGHLLRSVAGSAGQASEEAAGRYAKLLDRIQRTALGVVGGIAFSLVGGLIYAYFTTFAEGGQRASLQPDRSVHSIVIFNEMVPAGVLLSLASVNIYLVRNIRRHSATLTESRSQTGGSSAVVAAPRSRQPQPSSFTAGSVTEMDSWADRTHPPDYKL